MSAVPRPAAAAPVGAEPFDPESKGASSSVSAARGGLQLGVAAFVSLVANYLFLLGAGRLLGSGDYGTLAALVGLLTVVLLPAGALQMAVSREVSRREALGEEAEASAFVRALLVLGVKVTIPLVALSFLLLVPLRELLQIDASMPVALTLLSLVGIFVYPIALGVLQGEQRFRALAYMSAAPMVVRLLVFGALAIAGTRLYGALGAIAITAVFGCALGLVAVRGRIRTATRATAPALRPFLRYLVPVAVGLFGVAVLTNADILVVKARFEAEDAGIYGAASAFARVAFFLPATILAVLFPRTAARHARGEGSGDILGRSVIVTVAFCAFLTVVYSIVGGEMVRLSFGAEFAPATDLLVPFCIAMTLFSVANVLVGYHLSRDESRFAWIVAAAVPLQVLLLVTVPGSPREVLWVNAAVGAGLLLVHELAVGSSASALVAGYRVFAVGSTLRRWALAVAGAWRGIVEGVAAVAGYTLATIAVTWPLAAHMGDRMPGAFPNDGAGGAWWFWQLHQEEGGYSLLGVTHHTLTGAPLGWDTGNALNFQWLLPDYPGYLVAGAFGGLVALNFVTMSGLALSGAAMYWLTRWLGCNRLVAAWAGLVYLVFPWHLQRGLAGHVTLVHLAVFPLVLLAALAWLRRPDERRAVLVALAVVAAWLTSGYFGAMALVLVFTVAAVAVWTFRAELGLLGAFRKTIGLWAMPLIGTMLIALASILVGSVEGINIGRTAGDLDTYGAHLRDYLPDPLNPVVGAFVDEQLEWARTGVAGAEGSLYPGLLTVGLALTAVVLALRGRLIVRGGRALVAALAAVCVVAVACAAPSPVRVLGLEIAATPSRLLFEVLPAFRVPTRFQAVVMTGLVPLAALALAQLVGWARRRAGTSRAGLAAGVAIVGLATAITVTELPLLPLPLVEVGDTPAQYSRVTGVPGVLAEYPLRETGTNENSEYIFWQARHGRPLLNGAAPGSPADGVRAMLVDPSSRVTAPSLALLGVTTVVTRPSAYEWTVGTDVPDTRSYGAGYELVARYPGGVRVWRVAAAPAPALAAYRTQEVGAAKSPLPDGFVGYEVPGGVANVDLYARKAGLMRLRLEARAVAGQSTLTVRGKDSVRVFSIEQRTSIDVPVRVPRGHSTLAFELDPASDAASGQGFSLSGMWFETARPDGGARPLVPLILSPEPGF